MGMPMQPQQGPVSWETIMSMRNSARGQQPQDSGMNDAASRRLGSLQGQDPSQQMPQDPSQEILPGQTPDSLIGADQQYDFQQEDPPDINSSAAKRMMQYGAVLDFLRQAKGDVNNA